MLQYLCLLLRLIYVLFYFGNCLLFLLGGELDFGGIDSCRTHSPEAMEINDFVRRLNGDEVRNCDIIFVCVLFASCFTMSSSLEYYF